ncbi:cache domain-containing protein [Frigidibacter sp. MR17.14]|uniref:cache domain-containing protein n=1 Tax=Frigidibacter sp. MR17.14 TaxID=3126509 RepID=UPI003012B5FB
MSLLRNPTLAVATYVFAAFTGLVLVGFTLLVVLRFGGSVQDEAAQRAVNARTASAAQDLGREFETAWRGLVWLGKTDVETDSDRLRSMLDFAVGDGRMIRWAGYAGADGVVRASSGGLLEGADVSQRPWFQAGIQNPFAGDVHEAVLLASKLGGENLRFVDLAVPAQAGDLSQGVFAYHIDMAWLTRALDALARVRQLDLILVSRDGKIVYSTAPGEDPGQSGVLRAAAAGVPASGIETWSDGGRYAASTALRVVPDDMPNFGWRLVGRVDPTVFSPEYSNIYKRIGQLVFVACSILLFGAVLFVRVAIRPIERLTNSAYRIAAGKSEYPPEETGTVQARRLSAALAKLHA